MAITVTVPFKHAEEKTLAIYGTTNCFYLLGESYGFMTMRYTVRKVRKLRGLPLWHTSQVGFWEDSDEVAQLRFQEFLVDTGIMDPAAA